MKRLSVIVLLVMAFVLVWVAEAGAAPEAGFRPAQAGVSGAPAGSSVRAGTRAYPLGGSLLDFDGSPLPGGWVSWAWWDPDGYSWYCPDAVSHAGGSASAGKNGVFSFKGVTSLPGHDSLTVGGSASPGLLYAVLYHLDFSTTSNYVIRPGHVSVTVANAPAGKQAQVGLGDALYVGTETSVDLAGGSGKADAMPPDFNSARVSFPSANGRVTAECQWLSSGLAPVAVTPGAVSGATVAVDWRDAVHGHLAGPHCLHSGRPGSWVLYKVSNLPAGQQIAFVGYSWSPSTWGVRSYPKVVTSGGQENTYTVALRIPKRATVGTVYDVDAERSDQIQSMLWLSDYFEVCEFAATRSTIARGDGVRLRGHIDARSATLFMRDRRGSRPVSAKAKGWSRVGRLPVIGHGRFVSPPLHPTRTTWYVVRYHGVNGGFTAFTPVVRVSVR